MKPLWKFLWIYLAFLVQSILFENIKIFSCSPDILLTVVIISAVSMDFVPAAAGGAFAGLLIDVMYSEVLGIETLIYMCLALVVSLAADKKNCNSPLIMGWICFVSVSGMEIILEILQSVLVGQGDMGSLFADIVVKGIFAALLAFAWVLVAEFIKKRRKIEKATTIEEVAV